MNNAITFYQLFLLILEQWKLFKNKYYEADIWRIHYHLSLNPICWILENCNDLKFHHLHGRNARINNNGLTASRPNALSEFNDAIIMSNRPLRDGELFEIVIERMVERWSGCIEGMYIVNLQWAKKFSKVLRQKRHEIECLN